MWPLTYVCEKKKKKKEKIGGYIFQGLSSSLSQGHYFLIQTLLPALITSLYTCDRSDLCHQSPPKTDPRARCHQQSVYSAATSAGDDVNYGDDAHPPSRLRLQLFFRFFRLERFAFGVCRTKKKKSRRPKRGFCSTPGAQLRTERASSKRELRRDGGNDLPLFTPDCAGRAQLLNLSPLNVLHSFS